MRSTGRGFRRCAGRASLVRRWISRVGLGRPTGCPPAPRGRCRPWRRRWRRPGAGAAPAPKHGQRYWSPNSRSSGALHMRHVLRMGANAAEDPEHGLHEQRRLDQAAVEGSASGCRDARCVVALELELVPFALQVSRMYSMSWKLLRNTSRAWLRAPASPVVLERLVAVEQVVEAEIDRAHIQRGDLGLERRGRLDPFLDAHEWAAAGGDVDHRVGLLLDPRQEAGERLRGSGPACRSPGRGRAGG